MDAAIESRISLEVRLSGRDPETERREVRDGLLADPRRVPSRYFYDPRGSRLFERITALPEYYLTRAESSLLRRSAADIADLSRACDLIELGSGAATKTRILLDALAGAATLERYVAFDVDEEVVRRSTRELAALYPNLRVHGVVADFSRQLELLPDAPRRLVAFLGSTLGNLDRAETIRFFRRLASVMTSRDELLLGIDLVKRVDVLERAYNDSVGLTAEFNRNILRVLNRRFAGDFEPSAYAHRAFFDRDREWIEMRLVSRRSQSVRLAALDLELELRSGEEIRTEISTKYRRERIEALLSAGGFALRRWFSGDGFALTLASPSTPA